MYDIYLFNKAILLNKLFLKCSKIPTLFNAYYMYMNVISSESGDMELETHSEESWKSNHTL